MEVKEINRVVISKPIASRPNFTSFRLELISGTIDTSPSSTNTCSETTVGTIKPRTMRVMPTISQTPFSEKFQANTSEVAPNSSSDNIYEVQNQYAIFKPLAKVVSKETVALLSSIQQRQQQFKRGMPEKFHSSSNQHSSNPLEFELSQAIESPTTVQQIPSSSFGAEFASCDDGYNWRKYGQKKVKGCEFPRSYYKCTHPKCPVKKKVEKTLDGQITEIVYKGEHSHPKPDLVKRSSSTGQGQDLVINVTNQDHSRADTKFHRKNCEKNVGFERELESENSERISTNSKLPTFSMRGEETLKGMKVDNNGTKNKRRKHNKQNNEANNSSKQVQEPCIWEHSNSEPDIMSDGFRWRKYGQKVVRGNPYPRSYYRCTSLNCNVRKHVERALDEPGTVITTYEGRHNHDIPVQINNSSG